MSSGEGALPPIQPVNSQSAAKGCVPVLYVNFWGHKYPLCTEACEKIRLNFKIKIFQFWNWTHCFAHNAHCVEDGGAACNSERCTHIELFSGTLLPRNHVKFWSLIWQIISVHNYFTEISYVRLYFVVEIHLKRPSWFLLSKLWERALPISTNLLFPAHSASDS